MNFFSEDPVLAGELGAAMTQGIQSTHIAANVKHYAVNVQEYDRMGANAIASERTLREIYLRAFEIAIKKGDPWTIMTSYNKVNDQWVNSNRHLMKDILRDEWGYDGVVVSDGGAIHTNKVGAHLNGLDVEFCGPAHKWMLQEAYNRGQVPDSVLDEIARRVLTLYFKILEGREPGYRADLELGHRYSRKVDADGTVLLTNEGEDPPPVPGGRRNHRRDRRSGRRAQLHGRRLRLHERQPQGPASHRDSKAGRDQSGPLCAGLLHPDRQSRRRPAHRG